MDVLYKNIKARRQALKMTQTELAEKTGYASKSAIAKIEHGKFDLARDKIVLFAKALNTTPSALMGWEDEPIDRYANKIPLLGKIACGEPITAIENIEEYVCIPDFIKADFALTAQGDSMINAHISDGDIVYIRKQPTVESGEIAAVLIDDEATLKRVSIHGDIIVLSPENPDYPQLVYKSSEVKILGKAVNYIGRVK